MKIQPYCPQSFMSLVKCHFLFFFSVSRNSVTIVFVASSALKYFDTVFSAELDTMQPVLFVAWEDGFGRLREIFFNLYPWAVRINKLKICSSKQHTLGCPFLFYPFYLICQWNLFLLLRFSACWHTSELSASVCVCAYNMCAYNRATQWWLRERSLCTKNLELTQTFHRLRINPINML